MFRVELGKETHMRCSKCGRPICCGESLETVRGELVCDPCLLTGVPERPVSSEPDNFDISPLVEIYAEPAAA